MLPVSFKKSVSACTEVEANMPSSSRDGNGAVQQHVMINAQEPMADDVTLQTALSISADSSGITTIPLVTLDAI